MEPEKPKATPQQIRSARAIAGWSQRELAQNAKIATSTVADFERGARAATANNVLSMVEALEKAGVAFQDDKVIRRASRASAARKVDRRTSFRWVEVENLENWASGKAGQQVLPELIARLIRAERGTDARLRFPSGDAISMKGWDGISEVPVPSTNAHYVPSGTAGWELSAQQDGIKGKADSAYQSRVQSPAPIEPAQATFVFVTAHRWEKKDQWIKKKRAEGIWNDVRVYDAVDLVHWLELQSGVAAWLAEQINTRPSDLREIDSVWTEWSHATERTISPALVLAGRDEEEARVLRWLQEPSSALALQAETTDEAIAFLHAAISELPPDERDAVLTQFVVAKTEDAARKIGESAIPYIAVEDGDASLVHHLVAKGHHVCAVFGSDIGVPPTVLRLSHLLRTDVELALQKMGYAREEAESIARDIGGSLAVFRRLYPSAPERVLPEWAAPDNANVILPAFFAGAWDDAKDADKQALEKLSGKTYEEFEKALAPWVYRPDSPFRKSGSAWKIASPRDALFRLAPVIAASDLKRFAVVLMDVFTTVDPRYSLSPDQRWSAGIYGKMPEHSFFLKTGLGETLMALALFGETAKIPGSKHVTEKIVRDLLHGADPVRWWSLSRQMRLLAETAPSDFLSAVADSLRRKDPPVMELFKEDGGFFGGAHHSDLLWALESLAWDERYILEVALLLAKMARHDPGGRFANRPKESLRQFFVWWLPQTTLEFGPRLDVLDQVRRAEPTVGWELLLRLLPGDHDSLDPASKPRWREIPKELPDQGSTQSMLRSADAFSKRILEDVQHDPARWPSLIEKLPQLSPAYFEKAVQVLSSKGNQFQPEQRTNLWAKIRELLHKHRQFAGSAWALPEDVLSKLDPIYAMLEPTDRAEQIAWLFGHQSAQLPEKLTGGWQAYERESRMRRAQAVKQFWNGNVSEFERLASISEAPYTIGAAVADAHIREEVAERIYVTTLKSQDAKVQAIALGYIGRRMELAQAEGWGDQWAYEQLDRGERAGWSPRTLATVALIMRASRQLWDRVEKLGEEVSSSYWQRLNPHAVGDSEDTPYAVDRFLTHGRAIDSMAIIGRRPKAIGSKKIVEILMDAVKDWNRPTSDNSRVMMQYHLEQLLNELDSRADLPEEKIAELEWIYLPLLTRSQRSPKALHAAMSRNPAFFVDIIKSVYRASSEAKPADNDTLDEAHRTMVMRSYELLNAWHNVPGMEAGKINGAKLEAWVSEARRLAHEAERIDPCDVYIGKMLAYAPRCDEDIWPPEAVQNVIEISRSEVLERNISSGILDKQGVTVRDPNHGGELERGNSAQYRLWAERLRFKSPRTSRALENIAQMFDGIADRHDQEVEQRNWL